MKNLCIILALSIGNAVFAQKADCKIYYTFSDTIKKKIESVIIENKYANDQAYIIFSQLSDSKNGLLITECNQCPLLKIIRNTNRYAMLTNHEIPIIFQSDLFFVPIRGTKYNRSITPNVGGFNIVINGSEIIETVFQQ